jgi:hypothetical protein
VASHLIGGGRPPKYSTGVASTTPVCQSRVAGATQWPLGVVWPTPKGQKKFEVPHPSRRGFSNYQPRGHAPRKYEGLDYQKKPRTEGVGDDY